MKRVSLCPAVILLGCMDRIPPDYSVPPCDGGIYVLIEIGCDNGIVLPGCREETTSFLQCDDAGQWQFVDGGTIR